MAQFTARGRWLSSEKAGIATVSTVALATLAVFANGGGLGTEIVTGSNITFKTGIIVAGSIAVIMAIVFDGVLLLTGKLLAPWRRKRVAA